MDTMDNPDAIRVLICDDHPAVRLGVREMLQNAPDIEVVAEASTAEAAVEAALLLKPEVVFMDLKLPHGMEGIEAIRVLSRRLPDTKVVVLTGADTDANILRAIEAGAIGYRLKGDQANELVDAARRAAAGDSSLAPSAARRLVERHQGGDSKVALTDRQIEVLRAIGQGRTQRKEIARHLNMSEGTVKGHLGVITKRLGAKDTFDAYLKALKRGIVDLEP